LKRFVGSSSKRIAGAAVRPYLNQRASFTRTRVWPSRFGFKILKQIAGHNFKLAINTYYSNLKSCAQLFRDCSTAICSTASVVETGTDCTCMSSGKPTVDQSRLHDFILSQVSHARLLASSDLFTASVPVPYRYKRRTIIAIDIKYSVCKCVVGLC
jgi:hypothetical protein